MTAKEALEKSNQVLRLKENNEKEVSAKELEEIYNSIEEATKLGKTSIVTMNTCCNEYTRKQLQGNGYRVTTTRTNNAFADVLPQEIEICWKHPQNYR
jgi:predicted metalloprotease